MLTQLCACLVPASLQLTDRFASEQCLQKRCDNQNKYCGGTWAGATKMMGYIQQLGFDAMWMSPYTQQGPDNMDSAGYHGKQQRCIKKCEVFRFSC
jgi:alpha-amylase